MPTKHQTIASLTALAALLPGDVIHDRAPSSGPAPTKVVLACKDAANAKRARKQEKRLKAAGK